MLDVAIESEREKEKNSTITLQILKLTKRCS